MSIERVWINSDYPLEGVLNSRSKTTGVILCHPHPLYGGSMYNNVVDAMERAFSALEFSTLKFNFRGVGESQGFYGGGDGEVRDLVAAIEFLKSMLVEPSRLILAGYSFGAWICVKATRLRNDISDLFLVSYPFAFYDPTEVMHFRKRIYFVCGSQDDISPVSENLRVYEMLPQIEKSIIIIETDHFYVGHEGEIVDFIKRAFS